MKRLLPILLAALLVGYVSPTSAAPKKKDVPIPVLKPVAPLPVAATAPPDIGPRFEIYTSFSDGRKLVGFTDPRYTAGDKTDYLKSEAMTGTFEFSAKIPYFIRRNPTDSTLQEIFQGTEYLRVGGQLTGWSILNGSNVAIPKTGAPINGPAVSANLAAATRPGLGFFFGFGKSDFEVDVGVTMALAFENEGSRTRRVVDASGNVVLDGSGNVVTEQVGGRGLFISNAFVLPTLKFVWGARGNLQFIITAGRELFEFQRDYAQAYFRMPSASLLRLDLGIGFYPNATLFLQPNFDIGPITIGVRGGISLNYYDGELKRVSVSDAVYFGASISGRF